MAKYALTNEKLVECLHKQRDHFRVAGVPLADNQIRLLKKYTALVGCEVPTRNFAKLRAQRIARDLWRHVPDIFVLCAILVTPTCLATLSSNDYLQYLRSWWETGPPTPGLSSIRSTHAAILPRPFDHQVEGQEGRFETGGGVHPARPHITVLMSSEEGNRQTSTDRADTSTQHIQTSMSRTDEPLPDTAAAAYVVSSLEFKDLVDFLQNKQDCEHKFEIRVPLNNDPPSIVFPRKFCQDLLKYARERVKARIADGTLHATNTVRTCAVDDGFSG
ncbi:hypothetical protein DV735_g5130, partial [Chaetothyriales sp. CBS 134920]